GGKTIKIDLAVDGGNAFIGKGNFEMAAGMVVVVSFTLPGKKTENARFRPKL
ncbi:MAG: hypothetical protein HY057_03505, partial [Rhodospirillales bacterium]|nr:hypothetical protein [Rhodospirillales bacterium]